MRTVIPGRLFCGGESLLADPRQILSAGVEAGVAVAPIVLPTDWPRDLILVRIPLADDDSNPPDLLRFAVDSVSNLVRMEIPTLVLCWAGRSRSVCVAARAAGQLLNRPPRDCLAALALSGSCDVSAALWSAMEQAGAT